MICLPKIQNVTDRVIKYSVVTKMTQTSEPSKLY
jgi:hypothetical protein